MTTTPFLSQATLSDLARQRRASALAALRARQDDAFAAAFGRRRRQPC